MQEHMLFLRLVATGLLSLGLLASGAGRTPAAEAAPLRGDPVGPDPATPQGCTTAMQNAVTNIPVAITSLNTITSTLNIGGLGPYLWDVNVTTRISHTFGADLDIFLVSPAGITITLSTDNGLGYNNVFSGTVWNDQAGLALPPGPVTDYPFSSNSVVTPLAPEEPLGALVGQNPNGAWKLIVTDDAAGDTGALLGWSLRVIALNQQPGELQSINLEGFYEPITDGGTLTVTMPVEDPHAALSSLELDADIGHDSSNDLSIYLRSPGGVSLTVSTGNGLAGTFDNTEWYDAAGEGNPPGPVTDNIMVAGVNESVLAPEEPFAALNGLNPAGDWQLIIHDAANGQDGNLGAVWLNADAVTCEADMSVYARPQPDHVRPGLPFTYTLDAYNQAYASTNIMLTAILPLNAPFLAGDENDWDCAFPPVESVGGTVVCTRPALATEAGAQVEVRLRAPNALTDFSSTVTVSHAGVELNPEDDTYEPEDETVAHSANGNPWDVWGYTGAVRDGGQDAFDDWGQLRLRIFGGSTLLEETYELGNFNLTPVSLERWQTTTPVVEDTIAVSRALYAPANANWLRYVDAFTNQGGAERTVYVAWGGQLGAGNTTALDMTSSGNLVLNTNDTWATTKDSSYPVVDPPAGFVLRNQTDLTYQGPGIFHTPITDTWPTTSEDDFGHIYRLVLAPGQTARLAYFVVRGLGEGLAGPHDCVEYGGCTTPGMGEQVMLMRATAAALAANPLLCDVQGSISNWPGFQGKCRHIFLPLVRR